MGWHCLDLLADLGNDTGGPYISRIKGANSVHQLLDRDSRMVDLALRDKVIQDYGRATLHLIDIDASVEQQPLAAGRSRIDEWQRVVPTSRQGRSRIEPRPTPGCLEVELGHVRSRASAPDRPCLVTP